MNWSPVGYDPISTIKGLYISDDYRSGRLNTFGPYAVPAGEYFVMGDHRNNSNDSRSQEAITRDMIVGYIRTVLYLIANEHAIPFYEKLGMKEADDVTQYSYVDWSKF